MPYLTDHDLRQMDEAWLQSLPEPMARSVLGRVVADLKEARDRLNQNPANSSRPPGSRPPWESRQMAGRDETVTEAGEVVRVNDPTPAAAAPEEPAVQRGASQKAVDRQPGRQPGALGHGRTQKLLIQEEIHRYPEGCAACGGLLPPVGPAFTAWETIDVVPQALGAVGLKLGVTRTLLHEAVCACGHHTRARHEQIAPDPEWVGVALGEWRLLGPRLAAVVVLLTVRYRLSRVKVQELLAELFGLQVSIGLIDQTLRETGRAIEPLESALAADLERAVLVHADETAWREAGQALWLWVFVSAQTVLYQIGYRTKEIVTNLLSGAFLGPLMTDGYGVYRAYPNRLRCWAHLLRKLIGLAESTDRRVAAIGQGWHTAFAGLQEAVCAARGSGDPPGSLVATQQTTIDSFRTHAGTLPA